MILEGDHHLSNHSETNKAESGHAVPQVVFEKEREKTVELADYTPANLLRLRAFINTRRAIGFGIFAYLGQSKETMNLYGGQLHNIFLEAHALPLAQIPIKRRYDKVRPTENKGWEQVTLDTLYYKDFGVLQRYKLVELNKQQAMHDNLQDRNLSLAVIGKLLKLSLKYIDVEPMEIFRSSSHELEQNDAPTIRARILKALLVNNTSFKLTQLAQDTRIDARELFS